jgi:two-component system, sensor histidine kinase and response regulator
MSKFLQKPRPARDNSIASSNVLHHTPGYVYWKDSQNKYLGANLRYLDLIGLSDPDTILSKTDIELNLPASLMALGQKDVQVLASGISEQFSDDITLPSGESLSFYGECTPLFDGAGQINGIITSAIPINVKKKQEVMLSSMLMDSLYMNKIEQTEEDITAYLRGIVDSMPGCVYWKNAEHRYLGANKLCLAQLGLSSFEEIIGKVDEELWGRDKADFLRENDKRVMELGESVIYEEPTVINGQNFIFMAAKMPLKDKAGNVIGIIGTSVDITELKEMQKALEQEKIRAESANIAKSEFLATMSHELRTPLNAILGMSQILKNKVVDKALSECADIIYKSGTSLLSLINDILDFAKLDAGSLKLVMVHFDLRLLIEEVVNHFKHQAQSKGIEIIMDYNPLVPHLLTGDSKRVRQIIINLLGNAIKFTELGYVLISVECIKKTFTNVELQISIEDTGIGIEKSYIETVFEKFTQVDSTYSRQHEGTGLGLSITKQLIEMMNGTISVNSQLNKGSIFWCNIPFMLQPKAGMHRSWEQYQSDVSILIVTDHPVHARVIYRQIGSMSVVVSGSSAIATLENAFNEGTYYHIVIIDQKLTTESPEQLVMKIASNVQFEQVMLAAFTEDISQESHQRLQGYGYFCLIELPIQPSEFLKHLNTQWCHWQRMKEAEKDAIKNINAKILLVEDNILNQKVAKILLQETHCDVDIANNAAEAMSLAKKHEYDLIFMDIGLPGKNGMEITQDLRKLSDYYANVPIIAMTAHVLKSEREQAVTAGMDDVITKPIIQTQLQHILYKWIHIRKH